MKVLFVYPNLTGHESMSFGIAYISSYLKKYGHKTDLMDYTWGGTQEDCLKKIEDSKPDLVGFSFRTGEQDFCFELAEKIKNRFKEIPIVFGGIHPTVSPEECVQDKNVDYVVVGEAEEAMLELCNAVEKGEDTSKIQNIWMQRNGETIRNPLRPLLQDLDSLPYPDRDLFDFERLTKARNNAIDLLAGRGCPYICTYCINHIQQKLYKGTGGKFARMRSVDNVLKELEYLHKKYKPEVFNFEDDLFGLFPLWIQEFCDKNSEKIGVPFMANMRPETVTSEVSKALKKGRCKSLRIGIESGDEQLRKMVLKRYMPNERIIEAFDYLNRDGVQTYSFNMVGIPHETAEQRKATIDLNRRIKPTFLQVSIFQPYPGTELRDIALEAGWVSDEKIPVSHKHKSIMRYSDISAQEIKKQKQLFRFRVMITYKPLTAIVMLFIDYFYEQFTSVRARIPDFVKKAMIRFLRVLQVPV